VLSLRRTRAVARKELLHIVRDARSLGLALAVPVLMLLLFGYALSLDVDQIPTVIYDEDRTPQSRALAARFEGSRYFHILGSASGYQEIERRIDRDEALLAVVILPGFARDLAAGQRPQVQLIFDGSDSNTASIALGYTEAVLSSGRPGVEPRVRVWYNHELKSRNYIVPGLMAVILMIIAAMLTSLTIAREWETGTMEHLLATPVRPAELVLGKMAAFFLVGLADTLTAVVVGAGVFGVPLRGSILGLAATSCVFLFGALCWGILLSAATRSQLLAYQLGMITSFLPAFLLSGFLYAIENMPAAVQAVTHIVPARYFISILRGVFLKGTGLDLLWQEALFLVVYGTLVFAAATRKLRQKVA
jgi:ABC-2 type transport system permease protein